MQKSKNKFEENINLDILKRLNYIYDKIISKEKTLEYSKKINRLINHYKKTEVKDDVPKKTNGSAHTKTTIINLGPLRKFLSDSIMVAIL